MILTGVSFKGVMKTKGMHNSVSRITSARSFEKYLSMVMMGALPDFYGTKVSVKISNIFIIIAIII